MGEFAITIKTHYLKAIRVKHLQICISFEVSVGEKCCKFIRLDRTPLYKFPSHSQDEFKTFLKKVDLTLDKIHGNNPFLTPALGNFDGNLIVGAKLIPFPL